jgi:hypothetical protein
MLQGGEKLDEAIESVFGVKRDDFLQNWGEWVAAQYPRGR